MTTVRVPTEMNKDKIHEKRRLEAELKKSKTPKKKLKKIIRETMKVMKKRKRRRGRRRFSKEEERY